MNADAKNNTIKSFSDEVDSETLKSTKLTPVLDTPINTDENLIFCSTFQTAWNELCNKYIKGTLEIEEAPDYVEKLNALYKQQPQLSDDSYLAMSGTGKEKILDKINEAVIKKFGPLNNGELLPKLKFHLKQKDVILFAYLFKNIEFKTPFEITFHGGMFRNNKVFYYETFGFKSDYCGTNDHDYSDQFSVLYYKDAKKIETIIKLIYKSVNEEIIISTIPTGSTLEESYNLIVKTINSNINIQQPKVCNLSIPKLNFNIIHNYKNIIDKKLLNKTLYNYKIKKVIQKTGFYINKGGYRRNITETGDSLIISCPFIIYIKDKSKDKPYFAAYVANPEILAEETSDYYGEYDDEIQSNYVLEMECGYYERPIEFNFYNHSDFKFMRESSPNALLLVLKKKKHIESRLLAIYKETPLVRERYKRIIKLFAFRDSVNSTSSDGSTPLTYAVEAGDIDIVTLLLELGADVNKKRKDGKDALTIAKDQKNDKIIKLLLEKQK